MWQYIFSGDFNGNIVTTKRSCPIVNLVFVYIGRSGHFRIDIFSATGNSYYCDILPVLLKDKGHLFSRVLEIVKRVHKRICINNTYICVYCVSVSVVGGIDFFSPIAGVFDIELELVEHIADFVCEKPREGMLYSYDLCISRIVVQFKSNLFAYKLLCVL